MSTPIFLIDRCLLPSPDHLIAAVEMYIAIGTTVRVEDSAKRFGYRLCYEVHPAKDATRVLDATGEQIGLFASIPALVAYAEAITKI